MEVQLFLFIEMVKIAETPHHNSLGYVYSQTTAFLGMKVMGLAAYAKEEYFMKKFLKIWFG